MTDKYFPEGTLLNKLENKMMTSTKEILVSAMKSRKILEAKAVLCDNMHNLHVSLPCMEGIIPREEAAYGISEGIVRDIAIISRVNKPVCFYVKKIEKDENGKYRAILSRKDVQIDCFNSYIKTLSSGQIIRAVVTHLEKFGAFVDIGCGISSMIPSDSISVSRISHSSDRFYNGQSIYAVVKSFDGERVYLTHKELLGTWEENVSKFHQGETVSGIVRSVEDYGIFVELAPNLAGLAEYREGVYAGQSASVYIKAIIPEKMKIKLVLVDSFDGPVSASEPAYSFKDEYIKEWKYSPEESSKKIFTVFWKAVLNFL